MTTLQRHGRHKLAACPSCGFDGLVRAQIGGGATGRCYVGCGKCGRRGPERHKMADAATAWNDTVAVVPNGGS